MKTHRSAYKGGVTAPRKAHRLDAAEIADAALSAALVMALLTTGRLLAAGTFFQVLATIVMTVLAARRRTRVVVQATFAAASLAILLGGIGPVGQAVVSGLFGWCGGVSLRNRHGLLRHVGLALAVAWPVVSAVTLAFLAIFADFRNLSLENGRNQWLGLAEVLERIGLDGVVEPGTDAVDWSIRHWWLMVPILQAAITIGYSLIVRRLGRAILSRVESAVGPAWTVADPMTDNHDTGGVAVAVAPLPLHLGAVRVRRGDATVEVGPFDATVEEGVGVVLVGRNGRGKTSLFEGIAGLAPATGIGRAGAPGLGAEGGTALIGQRPETQVLGVRVIDDVRWGLDLARDAHALLAGVGLAERWDQATSELSGGELQRLAIAAALARSPHLLLSDEATAMLDPAGRAEVRAKLADVVASGTTVIHSTHLPEELSLFPRQLRLDASASNTPPRRFDTELRADRSAAVPVLTATGVGHVHGHGTPWARRVLTDIDVSLAPGQLTLVVGPNGSGKSTLARLLAGLDRPTEGTVTMAGEPLTGPHRRIGIAFQHPRLQLLRSTVDKEVVSLAGSREHINEALELLGFDPAAIRPRRIDDLSGGEQRRVLLAGLVARRCEVVILDEPLAGLDLDGRDRLTGVVEELLRRRTAVVVVSHDHEWARGRADLLVELTPGGHQRTSEPAS